MFEFKSSNVVAAAAVADEILLEIKTLKACMRTTKATTNYLK